MKILLTNDDGIESKITRALFEKLRENHDVTLIAPKHDKSGQGAAITLRTSVQIEKQDENIYAVDGTPADCVFMGLMAIMKDVPDIIVIKELIWVMMLFTQELWEQHLLEEN